MVSGTGPGPLAPRTCPGGRHRLGSFPFPLGQGDGRRRRGREGAAGSGAGQCGRAAAAGPAGGSTCWRDSGLAKRRAPGPVGLGAELGGSLPALAQSGLARDLQPLPRRPGKRSPGSRAPAARFRPVRPP